jgi:hypothetical protein
MNKKIELCLEKICQQGCQHVNQVIKQLEENDKIPEFDPSESQKILRELKEIMNCYK